MALFHQLLDATALRFAGSTALIYRARNSSYEELRQRSECLARGLGSCGIDRGDRVVIYLQNRPEVIEVVLACSRLGAIAVPVNPMLKRRQLNHIVRDCGASLMVSAYSTLASAVDLLDGCPTIRNVVACDWTRELRLESGLVLSYDSLLLQSDLIPQQHTIDRDPAAILYTSGSTGKPKGVIVSHRNLVSGAVCVSSYLGNTADDRLLTGLPLSFDYGFSQVSTAFAVGACAVVTNFSTAPALIQEVGTLGITGLAGVPTMWAHLAESEWPQAATKALRYITNSGGALPAAVIQAIQRRLPDTQIYCMYGLTEAFRSTYLDPKEIDDRPGSIGKAIPNQEILVLRADGSPCQPGEIGELVHRGSLVSLGYWNDRAQTNLRYRPVPPLRDELPCPELAVWSGDRVRSDADGYLYFVGRADDLIKTSGHRVSPTEIEEIVAEVPGVVEAVAVGVEDVVLGQRIAVAIVPASTASTDLAERIRQYCRMHMPPFMVPAEIHVLAAIPRTPNGKHDRVALIEGLVRRSDQAIAGYVKSTAREQPKSRR